MGTTYEVERASPGVGMKRLDPKEQVSGDDVRACIWGRGVKGKGREDQRNQRTVEVESPTGWESCCANGGGIQGWRGGRGKRGAEGVEQEA